jgi:hypothetical protein
MDKTMVPKRFIGLKPISVYKRPLNLQAASVPQIFFSTARAAVSPH